MAGAVKTSTPSNSKVNARGKTCLFACYATDHAKDCFVMMDPQIKIIVHFRDAFWLNRMYFQSQGTPKAPVMVNGLAEPPEEGSVSDSDESNSSASNAKRAIIKPSDSANSDSANSYDSN